ncbi:ABC transporter substrate-binding protein [Ramlibacter sp. WS9]|uniref:ABC transporter substrate-binding protein n=1 Tax=Ramlibacter sp. WS9 TaxID=1882741 RepID=UPI001E3050F3|nr:ABC transporter substrate-binding protein [Ramlibacter sp. WS9]
MKRFTKTQAEVTRPRVRKTQMLRLLRVAAVAFGAAALGLGAAHAADVKIGALYPFSGGLAQLGDESFRGLQIAVEERNAAGGINGNKIVLVKADAADAEQAAIGAQHLISTEKVTAVFGSYASGISLAATQVTDPAGVPYFELGAVADTVTGRGFRNVFRSNATAKNFAERTIEAVVKVVAPGLRVNPKTLKLAIIYEDGPYGTLVGGYQKEEAKRLGLTVVESQSYSAKSLDLASLVQRLKGAGADIVLQTSYKNDTILFFRQAATAGFKPKAFIGAGGGYSLNDTASALGTAMEGVFNVDFPQATMGEAGAPGLRSFVISYVRQYFMAPRSGHSLVNYVGAKAFLDILANAKSTDKEKIREAVLAYKKAPGTTATGWGFQFADNGQNQLATANLMQWQRGLPVTVYPPSVATGKPIAGR